MLGIAATEGVVARRHPDDCTASSGRPGRLGRGFYTAERVSAMLASATPAMHPVVHHALFGLAVASLAGAAFRVASATGATGLERMVAAAPLAAAAAVIEALVLGLVELGTDPLALTAAAAATLVAALRLAPRRGPGPRRELAGWWSARKLSERAAFAAAMGAGAVLAAWLLRHPYVGTDGIAYHLIAAIDWIREGTPGALYRASYEFPVGNYPLTNEVLLAWGMGISRSFVTATLGTPVALALTAAASWLGLRTLRVPGTPAALATAALCLLPLNVSRLNEASTDIPALAWLVCTGALAAGSARRPALLVPALVAAGLAVGTKTTTLPLAAMAIALAVWARRADLRRLALPLGLAMTAALAAGGFWYLRNLVDHGSPFWPFLTAPWGDDSPRLIELLRHSFLDRPRVTLAGRVDQYVAALAGGLILAAGGVLAPLIGRSRAAVGAGAAAAGALVLAANAPVTGLGDIPLLDGFSISALRYFVPALAASALALAIAARDGGRLGVVATAGLAAALLWNVAEDASLDFPLVPSAATLLTGAAGGAAAAVALSLAGPRVAVSLGRLRVFRAPRHLPALAAALATAAAAALLALPASGYVERHGTVGAALDAGLVRWFSDRPRFDESEEPVSMVRLASALLAGDRLSRPVELVPRDESCGEIRARGWVVLTETVRSPVRDRRGELFPPPGPTERCRFREKPAFRQPPFAVYEPRPERSLNGG
jgi:hypothetical protein